MKWGWLLVVLTISNACFGQLKYDANWVFGYGAGLHFDSSSVNTFTCSTYNYEANASFSSHEGDLLLYASNLQGAQGVIRDVNHEVILGGDDVRFGNSTTNALVFLPVNNFEDTIYLFHLTDNIDSTGPASVNSLHLTKVVLSDAGHYVLSKNELVFPDNLTEKMAIVKHADGKSWWIYMHKYVNNGCSREYVGLKVAPDGTIKGPYYQTVGTDFCLAQGQAGEAVISPSGRYLASAIAGAGKVDIFSINRCTGELIYAFSISHAVSALTYGCAFSSNEKLLYFTSRADGLSNPTSLYQYVMDSAGRAGGLQLLAQTTDYLKTFGQLELARNGKIYVDHRGWSYVPTGPDTFFTKCLSVINQPNLVGNACDLQLFNLCFPDTSKIGGGFPHFPNYNLAPLPIFQAHAGPDTLQCDNGYGITLGVPQVPNILYQWSPAYTLNDATIAQPLASPEEDTWYYLTATDTTATSCAVHVDSVLVQVTSCTGIHEALSHHPKLYPNPAQGYVYVETGHTSGPVQFQLFDLNGRAAISTTVRANATINLSGLSPGIYLYTLSFAQLHTHGKLVVR